MFLESVQQPTVKNRNFQYINFMQAPTTNETNFQETSELMDGDSSLNESMDSHNTSRCSAKSSASKSSRGGGRLRRGTLSPASMKEFLEKEAVSDEMPGNIVLQNHWPHQNLFGEDSMDMNVEFNLVSQDAHMDMDTSSSSDSKPKKQRDRRVSITLMKPDELLSSLESETSSNAGEIESDVVEMNCESNQINASEFERRLSMSTKEYLDHANSDKLSKFENTQNNQSPERYFRRNHNVKNAIIKEECFSPDRTYLSNTKRMKSTKKFEPSTLPSLSLEDFESRAFSRMSVRFEILRWKYQWEIVSNHAALRAREIFNIVD